MIMRIHAPWDGLIIAVTSDLELVTEHGPLWVDLLNTSDDSTRERISVYADRLMAKGIRLGEWLAAHLNPDARDHYKPEIALMEAWLAHEHRKANEEGRLRDFGIIRKSGESRWAYRRRGHDLITMVGPRALSFGYNYRYHDGPITRDERDATRLRGRAHTWWVVDDMGPAVDLNVSVAESISTVRRNVDGLMAEAGLASMPTFEDFAEALGDSDVPEPPAKGRRVPGPSLMRRLDRRRK